MKFVLYRRATAEEKTSWFWQKNIAHRGKSPVGVECSRYSFVLELLHDLGQLLRHWQTNSSGVLDDGDALIGAVEEYYSGA